VGVVRAASEKVVVEVTSTAVTNRVVAAVTGRAQKPPSVKLPAEPLVPQEPAVVLVVVPTVTEATVPCAWAGTIVTKVAASAPDERVPRASTWLPTQTSAKLADVGGVRAASVKAEVDVTSTVTMSRCLAASVKLPGRVVPQVPGVATPFTDVTIP
jgi:hypothetical protein